MRVTLVLAVLVLALASACAPGATGSGDGAPDPAANGEPDPSTDGARESESTSALSAAATAAHAGLTYSGPGTCLDCHPGQATDMHASVHYQWKGSASDLANGPAVQGKSAGAMNAYCINISGNWGGCSGCHVGRGARPEPVATQSQLENIDCLICHQKAYKRVKVDGNFVPDTAKMAVSLDTAVRTVHRPERANCVQCHAKGGGGDNFKRGDLALAHAATSDKGFDVHMATTGENMSCQSCHTFEDHRVAGRGSDLRPRDSDTVLACSNCHGVRGPHGDSTLGRHTARVACQTCHIRKYARNAGDTLASEATEMHRDWTVPEWSAANNRYEPTPTLANDVTPTYRFWNGKSWVYNLGDPARVGAGGRYTISEPQGSIDDPAAKLYPFKRKTALQPYAPAPNQLVALDTSVYFRTADVGAAVTSGLSNMGLSASEPYAFVTAEEYQALNHEVMPDDDAARCSTCHGSGAEIDLGSLGYTMRGTKTTTCTQCHKLPKENKNFTELHSKHKSYDCSHCHDFSRPERGLRMP